MPQRNPAAFFVDKAKKRARTCYKVTAMSGHSYIMKWIPMESQKGKRRELTFSSYKKMATSPFLIAIKNFTASFRCKKQA